MLSASTYTQAVSQQQKQHLFNIKTIVSVNKNNLVNVALINLVLVVSKEWHGMESICGPWHIAKF